MASQAETDFDYIYRKLMPALALAAVGDFDAEIEVDKNNSVRVNELLTGVSVLLEVIREKQRELEAIKVKTEGRKEELPLLDEILGASEK
jgi:hypothetical protein